MIIEMIIEIILFAVTFVAFIKEKLSKNYWLIKYLNKLKIFKNKLIVLI